MLRCVECKAKAIILQPFVEKGLILYHKHGLNCYTPDIKSETEVKSTQTEH